MHELSIAMALVRQLELLCQPHPQATVQTARVTIGPLAGVEGHLLQQAFPLAAAGSCVENCQLILTPSPVRILCPACQLESEVVVNRLSCPACGHWQTKLLSGDELILQQVVLNQESD
ncbi:MAG: hydrogenase maturation nickel metallochaperone HypA [Magnetococcales bacterium]|nr:hydrogenase maturation nickel metallochaperone HypA [Magnetococcales bacterium]NGZ26425.1 hydrogenase maturation nickel metallochaperone HypA [Magnetococcales bacterium]